MGYFAPWFGDLPEEQRPEALESFYDDISPCFVLARYSDGTPRAVFSDDNWEFGSCSEEQISFKGLFGLEDTHYEPLCHEIVFQMKIIMLFLIYAPNIRSQIVKPSTMRARIKVIRRLANACYSEGISFKEMDGNLNFQNKLKSSIIGLSAGWTNKSAAYQSKITFDEYHRALEFGCFERYGLSRIYKESDAALYRSLMQRSINSLRVKGSEPTMLIPTRILGNIIDNGLLFVDQVERCVESLRLFAINSHGTGEFSREYVERLGLSNLFNEYSVNRKNIFSGFLTKIQDTCRLLVHAFTGMRDTEVSVMPWDCYREYEIPGFGVASFIQSYHKKLSGKNYSEAVHWVTAREMKKVVFVAQCVADIKLIHRWGDVNLRHEGMPLWVSDGFLSKRKSDHYDFHVSSFTLDSKKLESFKFLNIEVDQADLDELFAFDMFVDWEAKENLAVGRLWPIATHQFRKSLAVYASRSGMVSLPSLGVQYKHISILMTAMYSDKSSFAESFIPKHKDGVYDSAWGVANDFNESRINIAASNFQEQVVNRLTPLIGAKGSVIQRQKDSGSLDFSYLDREATVRAMKDKRNPMRYTETVVGGCLRNGICESYGLDTVVPCVLDCPDAIIVKEKVEAYVKNLEVGLDYISQESLAYKATKREIERIKVMLIETAEVY